MQPELCFETICVENRQLKNIKYHQARLSKTRKDLWGYTNELSLADLAIPDFVTDRRHKLRIAFSLEMEEIRWELHVPRTISSIKKVYDDEVDYSYKYNDRSVLIRLFDQRGNADEILIIKNGLVTDSFYCNVAFSKNGVWFTPTTNLLPGTQRNFLLDKSIINEAVISEKDILKYSHIRLFNALTDWDSAPELEIGLIS
jgi:4-amino-4-deoxychorismate lyase